MLTYVEDIIFEIPIPALDIKKGDSLSLAIERLSTKLDELKKETSIELYPANHNITADKVMIAPVENIGSSESKMIEGKAFNYSVMRTDASVEFAYDLKHKEVPEGFSVVATSVTITGTSLQGRSQLAKSRQPQMSMSIPFNRFPITMDARLVLSTKAGEIELVKQLTVNSDKNMSQETPFEIIDRTNAAGAKDVAEAFSQVFNRIALLESKK